MTTAEKQVSVTESKNLELALDRLVFTRTLTTDQARAVHEAYLDATGASPPAAAGAAEPVRRSLTSKLAELGAYLGAALMVAAGAVAVGQQWDVIHRAGQVALLLVLAAALVGAGLVVVRFARRSGSRSSLTERSVLRRLASTLLTLGAAATAGGVVVAMLPAHFGNRDVASTDVGRALVVAAVISATILVLAHLVAPSALEGMALYAAVLAASGGVLLMLGADTDTPIKFVFFLVGVGWSLLATFTRAITVPTLATTLGLATAFLAANIGESAGSRQAFLAALVAIGVGVYLARPSWPYVVVAMLSAVTLTVSVLGPAFGPALALLAAGFVLLVFAGAVLLFQRRRKDPDRRDGL